MIIKHVDNHVESPLKKQGGGEATSFCVTEMAERENILSQHSRSVLLSPCRVHRCEEYLNRT
jgi:hypothetical protein